MSLRRKEQLANARILANDLRKKYGSETLRQMWMDKSIDAEFKAIGELILGDRSIFLDEHIPVWAGWEQVSSSKYLEL